MTTQTVTSDIDVNLAEAADLGNALIVRLNRLREHDPIFFSKANGTWIVTGHKQVSDGLAGKVPLSSVRLPDMVMTLIAPERRERDYPLLCNVTRNWVINMDRPASWRLRNLAQNAFSQKMAESVRPKVQGIVRDAFAAIRNFDELEFVDAVARRVPASLILHLFGLDAAVYPSLQRWASTLNAALSGINIPAPLLADAEQSMAEMRNLLLPEIERRRATPAEDFISLLVAARDGEDRMTEDELIAMLIIVLIAGHDTTANTIALSTAALAEMPEARQFIRDNPDRLGNAAMELMRHIAMTTTMARLAPEDFEWEGHAVKKGEFVLLALAAANRDPAVFPEPAKFEGNRPQSGNMAFAPGLHFCIGHFLARMQVEEAIGYLIDRYDPVVLDDRLHFGSSVGFRGVDTMNVRLEPRQDD